MPARGTLYDALTCGGIVYDLPGNDRDGVLAALVAAMQLPADADRALLLKTLREREEMASTGVGDGVALPHVRNPVLLSVPKPIVTLAFLARPVDWEALDKKPVSVVFSLVSPCVRSHLHMLSRLVFALKDAGFREALARRGSPDEILREVARVESMLLPSPAFPVLE